MIKFVVIWLSFVSVIAFREQVVKLFRKLIGFIESSKAQSSSEKQIYLHKSSTFG